MKASAAARSPPAVLVHPSSLILHPSAMSYRAFKRLLGETSLERECRFLFGAGILLLITASFWLYAYQTEHLAYDQATTTCRVLVTQCFDKEHMKKVIAYEQKQLQERRAEDKPPAEGKSQKEAI